MLVLDGFLNDVSKGLDAIRLCLGFVHGCKIDVLNGFDCGKQVLVHQIG